MSLLVRDTEHFLCSKLKLSFCKCDASSILSAIKSTYSDDTDKRMQSSRLYPNRWQHDSPMRTQCLCKTHKVYDISPQCLHLHVFHWHIFAYERDSNSSQEYNIAQTNNILTGVIACGVRHLGMQHENAEDQNKLQNRSGAIYIYVSRTLIQYCI